MKIDIYTITYFDYYDDGEHIIRTRLAFSDSGAAEVEEQMLHDYGLSTDDETWELDEGDELTVECHQVELPAYVLQQIRGD